MSYRKREKLVQGNHHAVVAYSTEWQEFRVRFNDKPESDYFTDDKQDAYDTAKFVLDRL